MATTDQLPTGAAGQFDYIIVGGGTAGCVIASRLSSYLPHKNILVIEGGPSDVGDNRALILKDRFKMQGTDLDYAYTSVEQPNGMYSESQYLSSTTTHCKKETAISSTLEQRSWVAALAIMTWFPFVRRSTTHTRGKG